MVAYFLRGVEEEVWGGFGLGDVLSGKDVFGVEVDFLLGEVEGVEDLGFGGVTGDAFVEII